MEGKAAPQLVALRRSYAVESLAIVEKARQDGISVFIEEGTHEFVMSSGAKLKVFTSPCMCTYMSPLRRRLLWDDTLCNSLHGNDLAGDDLSGIISCDLAAVIQSPL